MTSKCVVRLAFTAGLALSAFSADLSVTQMQQILKYKGYYDGKIDGVAGPKTKGALEAYQRSQNLPATGTIDAKTAERLQSGVATDAKGPTSAAVKDATTSTDSTVKDATGTVKEAGKEASSSASSEAKGALGEVKGVFGSKKKTVPK